jgi:hypothetical protein
MTLGFHAAVLFAAVQIACAGPEEERFPNSINVTVPPIATDPLVRYDYDIAYVRAPRAGDERHKRFYTDFSQPVTMEPGADLMLLHPDGTEELLVAGGNGSITDPVVSLDGEWIYYSYLYDLQKANQWSPPRQGADIFKIHVKTRRIVKLTDQTFTPNTGAARGRTIFARRVRDVRTTTTAFSTWGRARSPAAESPSPAIATDSNRQMVIPPSRCSCS